jgi:hypothetical protein
VILLEEGEYSLVCEDELQHAYRVAYCGKRILCCPCCGSLVRKRDTRKRVFKEEQDGSIRISRVVCLKCKRVHTVLPYCILPHKHYSRKVIEKIRSFGRISDAYCSNFRGENSTIYRWRKIG